MNILKKLEKQIDTWFLIGISFFFFLLRLPSLFEPLWYGDEGIYEVIGKAIQNGRLLYRDIWDNKPPLLYLIYSLFGGSQFAAKLLSLIIGSATIIAFFFLAKLLIPEKNKNNKIYLYFSTLLFSLLFGLPILEGNIANAENFMLFPIIIAGLLILFVIARNEMTKQSQRDCHALLARNDVKLFFSGLLLGLAFLIKIVAIFDITAFGTIFFITSYSRLSKIKKQVFSLLILAVGFIIPILIVAFYFLAHGALHDFIYSAFSNNVGYVGYANSLFIPRIGIAIPQGLLILKLIILIFFVLFILYKRKTFNSPEIFIYIWFAFSLFNMLFSQRAYAHYALVIIPSFCLLIGYILTKRTKKIEHIIVIFLISILIIGHFKIFTGSIKKTLGYYENFFSFMNKSINVDTYYSFFDPITVTNKILAQYININKKKGDKIFIWGNSGQLYLLTNDLPPGRYIVSYHITYTNSSLIETKKILEKAKPKYIIILPNQPVIPYSLKNYLQIFFINGAYIYEKHY